MWAIVWGFIASNFITEGCLGSSPGFTVNTRIVGGEEVDIRNVPYQVSIQYNNNHFCGGAFITNNTVISAAHCFGSSYPPISFLYTVKYGSNTTQGSSRIITSVLVHEKFNSTTKYYDVCLIRLNSTAELSETASLIRLSESSQYTWGSLATVSDWGYQEGDSGGPLVQDNKLIWIVSFGMGCARASFPGVYTNVAELVPWVVANSDYTSKSSSNNRLNGAWMVIVILMILAT